MAALKKLPARSASLESLRKRIDEVSLKLMRLLSERATLAQEIGRLKRSNGAEIYQPVRERQFLDWVAAKNCGPLTDKHIRRIFTEVMSACRSLQHELRVAYLGPEHTFTHQAAISSFGGSAAYLAEASITGVFDTLENERADFGVVPVENSTEGSVTLTLDLLIDTSLVITGEVLLPIRHSLMSQGGDPTVVRRIISHQQSLAQCRVWLAANYPHCDQQAVASNALASQQAAGDPSCAAIGWAGAARAYGLRIIADGIQDSAHNATRFLVIGRNTMARSGADKTTVLFAVPDRVGALNHALTLFARNSINISKIESRPMRSRPWEYLFFLDLTGHRDDPNVRSALEALGAETLFLKVLGSYPEARSTIT